MILDFGLVWSVSGCVDCSAFNKEWDSFRHDHLPFGFQPRSIDLVRSSVWTEDSWDLEIVPTREGSLKQVHEVRK
jgi:hypothetical protein